MPHEYDRFWSTNRVKAFRDSYPSVINNLNWSPESVRYHIQILTNEFLTEGMLPSEETCRRTIKDPNHKTSKKFLSGLLIGTALHIKGMGPDINEADPSYSKILGLYDRFAEEMLSSSTDNRDAVETTKPDPYAHNRLHQSLEMIAPMIGVDVERISQVKNQFFKDSDESRIFFECFRFSARKGFIRKSFTVLHRPTLSLPLVRFANYYEVNGRVRRAEGVVLPMKSQLVMLGHADSGKGVKVVALPDHTDPQNEYQGLVTTIEPDGTPVAARIVLRRSQHQDHEAAGATDEYPVADIAEQEGLDLVDAIRNRVPFVLENPLFQVLDASEEQEINQKELVSLTDRSLSAGGKPLIVDDQRRGFNPADDYHYTFNSVLKLTD